MSALRLRMRVEARNVELDVTVPAGTVALLGANGSGKSTVLEAIAGLIQPDAGELAIDDHTLFRSEPPRIALPPHRRGVGLLTQDPALFPHLDVLANAAFGPRSHGVTKDEANRTARRMLELVGAAALAGRRATALSGGQAQRVALARALAVSPRLLLLDEPLAAVDVEARDEVRAALRVALAHTPTVLVTHDISDALRLADHAIVLQDGRVIQHGATAEVLARPRSPFLARLAGLNLLHGTVSGGRFTSADDLHLPAVAHPDGPAYAAVPPIAVAVVDAGTLGVQSATVTGLEPRGATMRVQLGPLTAELLTTTAPALVIGDRVGIVIDAAAIEVYPASMPVSDADRLSR